MTSKGIVNEQVTIQIPLKSGGRIDLLLDDARELRNKLNEVFDPYPVPALTFPCAVHCEIMGLEK